MTKRAPPGHSPSPAREPTLNQIPYQMMDVRPHRSIQICSLRNSRARFAFAVGPERAGDDAAVGQEVRADWARPGRRLVERS